MQIFLEVRYDFRMAKRPRGSTTRPVQENLKQFNLETREAVGLSGRLLRDLSQDELQELAATYLFEGYDALRTKYALSRGEVLALLSMPGWVQMVKTAAVSVRASVVLRTMHAMPALTDILVAKASQSPTVQDSIEALRTVKETFLEVGGMGQPATHNPQAEPSALAQDEQASLQQLQQHLTALADAKLISETPRATQSPLDKANGNGNGNGNGHSHAA